MVDSVSSSARPEYLLLNEAAQEFGISEAQLIAAGIEGRIRFYFWLNEVRLAQRVKYEKEAEILVQIGEPQRARFYYIPVFRPQLAELASGRDAEASALTRADDDGADGEYWSFMWDRDQTGTVIQMPQITRAGLFVRRSDLMGSLPAHKKATVEKSGAPLVQEDAQRHDVDAKQDVVQTRKDDIQIEIDDAVAAIRERGERATPATVMPLLKNRAGRPDSCISEAFEGGVIWIRGSNCRTERLTINTLKSRLGRRSGGALKVR
jgi:hypothetical protein